MVSCIVHQEGVSYVLRRRLLEGVKRGLRNLWRRRSSRQTLMSTAGVRDNKVLGEVVAEGRTGTLSEEHLEEEQWW